MGAPAKITDQMVYLVTVNHESGPYSPERVVADMDRKSTVEDIACGQLEDVLQVFEFNPVEHTSRDCTEDILREAAFAILDGAPYDDLNDWQRRFVDRNAAGALIAHRHQCCAEDTDHQSARFDHARDLCKVEAA